MSNVYAIEVDNFRRMDDMLYYVNTTIAPEAFTTLDDAKKYINDRCQTTKPNGMGGIEDGKHSRSVYTIRTLQISDAK